MSRTLDVRGDMTFVCDDDQPVGMVQPDTYAGDGWSSWLPNTNVWDPADWDFHRHHETREQALAAVGWAEGADR